MSKQISFYGASGGQYVFDQMAVTSPWAALAGVAVFAAPDAYGWRIIRVIELTGRAHDVRPVWAMHDAERYGASAVFVAPLESRQARLDVLADLDAGLSPVLSGQEMEFACAA